MSPPSLLRARDILARNTSSFLPDIASLSRVEAERDLSDPLSSALLEASFLVASADGQLAKEEIGELSDLISQITSQSISPQELSNSIEIYSAQLERSGRSRMIEALAAACSEKATQHRVIGFAALVALCDRELAPSELFVLHSIGKAFGFSASEVNEVIRALKQELEMEVGV